MFSFRTFLALFLLVPIFEIYLLIQVGGLIGVLPTMFLVVFTAVVGAWLLRSQGFATLGRVQATLARGEIPAIELLEGAMLLVGGALLLTPGFFTDAIGFVCLIPVLRRGVISWAMRRGIINTGAQGASRATTDEHGSRTIEGEYWKDDEHRP
ncbi:FxsA family protein [Pseudomonadota bacterium]